MCGGGPKALEVAHVRASQATSWVAAVLNFEQVPSIDLVLPDSLLSREGTRTVREPLSRAGRKTVGVSRRYLPGTALSRDLGVQILEFLARLGLHGC